MKRILIALLLQSDRMDLSHNNIKNYYSESEYSQN